MERPRARRRAQAMATYAAAMLGAQGALAEVPIVNLFAVNGPATLGGSKCGVAVSPLDEGGGPPFNANMLRIGAARGLAWQTGWSEHGLPPGFSAADYGPVRLVGQFWGAREVQFQQFGPPPLASVMLGFNEPDQGKQGGSGMTVPQALDLWMNRVTRARAKGYTEFVAPSIAKSLPSRYTHQELGSEWLPQFLGACLKRAGCPESISYLGFHLYEPDCATTTDQVLYWSMGVRVASMKKLMAEFNSKGMHIKGLWLTEFAGRSDKRGLCRTLTQQQAWLEKIVPMLNSEPAVRAYSWFSYGEGRSPFFLDNANLWDYSTGNLNELGEAYFRLCVGPYSAAPPSPPPTLPPTLPPTPPAPVAAVPAPAPGPGTGPGPQPIQPFPAAPLPSTAGSPAGSPAAPTFVPMPQQPTFAPVEDSGSPVAGFAIFLGCTVAVLGAATSAALCWFRHAKRQEGEGALESYGIPAPVIRAFMLLDDWVGGCWGATRRAVRVDLAMFGSRFGCEGLAMCGDSSDDGEARDGNWQPAVEELARSQPQLARTIADCCTQLDDRRRFENECETTFQALRRAVMALPPTAGGRGSGLSSGRGLPGLPNASDLPGAFSLEDIPAKALIWNFVLRVSEQRRFYRAQAGEVAARLELSPAWVKALSRDPSLRRRRADMQQQP